jgi:hypothetical protein
VSWLRGGKDQPQAVPDAAALDTVDAVAPE